MSKLSELIQDKMIKKVDLCNKANISRPTLDNLINNNPRFTPTLSTIKSVCKALDVDWKDYV